MTSYKLQLLATFVQQYLEKMERFSVESCVRGYHVCKDIWEASVGEELHRFFVVASAFFSSLFASIVTARGTACDRGHCGSEMHGPQDAVT